MESFGSLVLFVTCGVTAIVSLVCCFLLYRNIKSLYSKPNENTIQITIDRRFLSVISSGAFALLFFFTFLEGANMTQRKVFIDNEQATSAGDIGNKFLAPMLEAKPSSSCSHVNGGKEIVVYLPSEDNEAVYCGASLKTIESQHMYPYIEKEGRTHVLIGKWPFTKELVLDSTIDEMINSGSS